MWADGHTTVNALWDAFARYPHLPRLKNMSTLVSTVRQGANPLAWEIIGFALADAIDTSTGRYIGLITNGDEATIIGTTLIVRPDIAAAQLAEDVARKPPPGGDDGLQPSPGKGDDEQPPADDTLRRFYAVARLDSERYQRDFSKIAAEVIANLAGLPGTSVEISVEIKATNNGGFPEHTTRTVAENARTLKLEAYGFERD
jgi:hypothetical protein